MSKSLTPRGGGLWCFSTYNLLKHKDTYISIDIEIGLERIIMMSTSYSSDTKDAFDNLESALKKIFGETNVEECFDTKTLYGHSCFQV